MAGLSGLLNFKRYKLAAVVTFSVSFVLLLIRMWNFYNGTALLQGVLGMISDAIIIALIGISLAIIILTSKFSLPSAPGGLKGWFGDKWSAFKGGAGKKWKEGRTKARMATAEAYGKMGYLMTGMIAMLFIITGIMLPLLGSLQGVGVFEGPIREGIIFLLVGVDFLITSVLVRRSYKEVGGEEGGEVKAEGPSLWVLFGITFGLMVAGILSSAAIVQFSGTGTFGSYFTSGRWLGTVLFMLTAKVILTVIYYTLGLQIETVKEGLGKSEFFLGPIITYFFGGIVVVIAIMALIMPAYYLMAYSGGTEITSMVTINNPILYEFARETEDSAEASLNALQTVAKSLVPEEFEGFVIDVDALGAFGVALWSGLLGMPLTNNIGEPVEVNHILFTILFLFLFLSISLVMMNESKIGFKELKDSGEEGFIYKIYRKLWWRAKR